MYLDGTGRRKLTAGPSDGMGQWSPDGHEVVFARGDRGERDIYRLWADGTGLRRLTYSFRDDHSPSWSRRNQVAFVRSSGRSSRVYTMPSRGGTARRLTRGRANETNPAWSPTGRTLVVSRGRAGKRDLYLVRSNGAGRRRLTATPGDEIEPSWSPDGSRIVFTHRRRGKRRIFLMKVRGKPIRRLPRRSVRVRRIATSGSPGQPSWQPTGLPPVIAAGDIACDPESLLLQRRQRNPGQLPAAAHLGPPAAQRPLLDPGARRHPVRGRRAVEVPELLPPELGPDQAPDAPDPGQPRVPRPGRGGLLRLLQRGRPGERPGGARGAGYYSFDLGSWHVIALNSECEHIGGCGPDSPQLNWLRSDLAAHPVACTLVYWHRPPFASGPHTDQGDMLLALNAIYAAGADLLLTGHEHFYERLAPMTPTGAVDRARGIREFIAGMGGKSVFGLTDPHPGSEFGTNGFYGVLEVTLEEGAYRGRRCGRPRAAWWTTAARPATSAGGSAAPPSGPSASGS